MNAISILRECPPLVVDLGRGFVAWIERGIGWTCGPSGQWVPMVDAEGIGGRVLTSAQIAELVLRVGRPT